MSTSLLRTVVPLVLVALAGCSSKSNPSAIKEHEPADAGDSGKQISGLSLKWRIVESVAIGLAVDAGGGSPSAADYPGIPGVRVCVYQHPELPCATSESDGKFTLVGLPATTELVLTTQKDGYVKTLRAIVTASTPMDEISSPLIATKTTAPAPDVGVAVDDTKGAISFLAVSALADGGLALPPGVGVTLSPGTADGPYFTRADNTLDKNATMTAGGGGIFLDVTPGNYVLTFHYDAADCRPISYPFSAFGFPSPPTSVRFPVLLGYVTDQIAVLCTPKSVFEDSGAATKDASSSQDR